MRILKSKRFGDLTVSDEDAVSFSNGLIGFSEKTEFFLIEHKSPFFWLHSADDPELAFAVVDGGYFKDLDIKVSHKDPALQFITGDQIATLFVLTMTSDPVSSTVNLKAPLVINMRTRRGVQVIVEDDRYSVTEPLKRLLK